jgi:secreted trypsin-like serine protease
VTLDRDCGGALIAPDIVLTAGHCKPSKSQYKTLRPRVGTYSFTKDKRGVDYEDFKIVTSIRHPNFKRLGDDEFIYDFSIIQLDRPVSRDIIPVRINRNDNIPATRSNIVAMGMGYTKADYDSLSNILKQVTLNPVSNKLCARSTDGYESYRGRIHASHMCTTGGPRNKRDACAYDSGSPIIIPADRYAINRHEGDLLVGLVSWGHGCADPDFPGTFLLEEEIDRFFSFLDSQNYVSWKSSNVFLFCLFLLANHTRSQCSCQCCERLDRSHGTQAVQASAGRIFSLGGSRNSVIAND